MNINNTYQELKEHYDKVLNVDKSTYFSSNDEPTPISCIEEMISSIDEEIWTNKDIKILDPCCGNGNFFVVIFYKLLQYHSKKDILEDMLYFNDINTLRLDNVRNIFLSDEYKLNITNNDYINEQYETKYDLIVANPPYAKILESGARASKNHNLIKIFLEKSLSTLKSNGYLLFITPDNWMSFANSNKIINTITKLQIIRLDIHSAKKYFKKIGSSFTWYLIENTPFYKDVIVSGIIKKNYYSSLVKSMPRDYIPLYYNQDVQNILLKTVECEHEKFNVQTSSYLHRYTKKHQISTNNDNEYMYRLIHTPKQTVYSKIPHIYQDGYKVFISTTDKYKVFIDHSCGMTQSIAFILCEDKKQAEMFMRILNHPLYKFINDICRWGNFNNIKILKSFPVPKVQYTNEKDIFEYFGITKKEISIIQDLNLGS